MIDWNPVILAIIALIGTIITTLIPIAVTAFFTAQTARLEKLKAIKDKNQAAAEAIVRVIQQTKNAFTNSEKFALALLRIDEELHLPINTTRGLIDDAVASLKLAWGPAWDKLGGKLDGQEPETPVQPPIEPIPPTELPAP
jgi:hypothetical protein